MFDTYSLCMYTLAQSNNMQGKHTYHGHQTVIYAKQPMIKKKEWSDLFV